MSAKHFLAICVRRLSKVFQETLPGPDRPFDAEGVGIPISWTPESESGVFTVRHVLELPDDTKAIQTLFENKLAPLRAVLGSVSGPIASVVCAGNADWLRKVYQDLLAAPVYQWRLMSFVGVNFCEELTPDGDDDPIFEQDVRSKAAELKRKRKRQSKASSAPSPATHEQAAPEPPQSTWPPPEPPRSAWPRDTPWPFFDTPWSPWSESMPTTLMGYYCPLPAKELEELELAVTFPDSEPPPIERHRQNIRRWIEEARSWKSLEPEFAGMHVQQFQKKAHPILCQLGLTNLADEWIGESWPTAESAEELLMKCLEKLSGHQKTNRRGARPKYPKTLAYAAKLKNDPALGERTIYRMCKEKYGKEEKIPAKLDAFVRSLNRYTANLRKGRTEFGHN